MRDLIPSPFFSAWAFVGYLLIFIAPAWKLISFLGSLDFLMGYAAPIGDALATGWGTAALIIAGFLFLLYANYRRQARGDAAPASTTVEAGSQPPASTDTDPDQAQVSELQRLRGEVESLSAQRDRLQGEVNSRDADREMYRGLLMAALKEGLRLRESNPGKEAAQKWASHLHKLLEAAEGEWRVKPFRRPTPGYAYADLDATGEQAFMDYQLAKLQDLIRLVESRQTIKFRSGFDPHEWKDWKTPPGDELKRRCAGLAEELTKFLDAWENFRDQPKIYPEKPGDWPKYTMEQYRPKFEQRLATLLDDLEERGWLTSEARAHFEVPTHNPQTIRKVAARLSSICQRD